MEINVVRLVRLALAILADKILTFLALGMTFALACWVMKDPDWMREGMAGFFALFVFIPCILKERTKRHDDGNQAPETE